jgi:hypothetical protein
METKETLKKKKKKKKQDILHGNVIEVKDRKQLILEI